MSAHAVNNMSSKSVSRILAEWAATLRFEDLPPEVLSAAKRSLLDTLAVAWAGSSAEGVDRIHYLISSYGGPQESEVWAFGGRLPVAQAAFINGILASALDFDSVHDQATVHADIVNLPVVLALAARENLNGREALVAFVVGNELLVRLGLGIRAHPGWFYSSVLGVFTAAAAASRVLRLGTNGILRSMGIALSRAAGTQQPLVERSMTKRLQSAFAARDGVESALLAQLGVTGPEEPLEGCCGFSALYSEVDWEIVLLDLGKKFTMTELSLKKYPSCLCNHAAIEAALRVSREHGLRANNVADVIVQISPFMERLVGAPFSPGNAPQIAAQFSVQYSVACALLRGKLDIDDIDPVAVLDPEILALAQRIQVKVDDSNIGKFVPVSVTVHTTTGVKHTVRVDTLPGTPALPITADGLYEKAMHCLTRGACPMTRKQAVLFVERAQRFEELDNVSALWYSPSPTKTHGNAIDRYKLCSRHDSILEE